MEENLSGKYTVPMLFKGMLMLEVMASHPEGLTIPEMVGFMDLNKSSVYRIVNSFLELGYIYRIEDTGKYFITRKLFNLGLAGVNDINIAERAIEPMRTLRDKVKEAVFLGILVDSEVVLIEQMIGNYDFSFVLKPGTKVSMHASAPGKSLLSFMDKTEQDAILRTLTYKKFNQRTIGSRKEMEEEMEQVRSKGYAIDFAEQIEGVNCIAAPIFNHRGRPEAAIWISGPSGRMNEDLFDELSKEVIKCADQISMSLGYIG